MKKRTLPASLIAAFAILALSVVVAVAYVYVAGDSHAGRFSDKAAVQEVLGK